MYTQTKPARLLKYNIVNDVNDTSAETNATFVYSNIDEFNQMFGQILTKLGLPLLEKLPPVIEGVIGQQIWISSEDDLLSSRGFTKIEYDYFDIYYKNNNKDTTLFSVPFPHVDMALFYQHYDMMLDTVTDVNHVFLLGHKAFFGTENITKDIIDSLVLSATEGVLDLFPNTKKVISTSCLSHTYSKPIIPLFDKMISYSPMVKQTKDMVMSPYELIDPPERLPVNFLNNLFTLKQSLPSMPYLIRQGYEKLNLTVYTSYFDRFAEEGDDAVWTPENVLVATPNDRVVVYEEYSADNFQKTHILTTPLEIELRQMHAAIYVVELTATEYLDILKEETI